MKRDVRDRASSWRRITTAPFLLAIRFYRRVISPALPARCKYYPSCSAYAEQAVRELGVVRGLILASWRLVRCNPFSHGGVDLVEDRRLFRDRGRDHERQDLTDNPGARA